MGISASQHKGRPLDPDMVKRINQLYHDQNLSKSLIARRLGIAVRTVCVHLTTREAWQARKNANQ